jgi:hypothetical protein
MNNEGMIQIKVDILFLHKYFPFDILGNAGKIFDTFRISSKYYDQVKELLSEYGIQDQQAIDNFCYLEMIFWGQNCYAKKLDSYNEVEEELKIYYSDLSKLGSFIEEYSIQTISFKGNSKTIGARKPKTISLHEPQIITEAMEGLSRLINLSKLFKERGYFDLETKGRGGQVTLSSMQLKETFFKLRKFLHALPFPKLNDLSETEENFFAGRLFCIAGIIEPFSEEKQYLSSKDYLVKRMKKHR